MRKFFLGIIILITLITAFIAFMFYHEQSSGELVGRSVSLEWAKEAVGHGAGNIQYFVDLFTKINVTGALVGALLHNKVLTIKDIKKALYKSGVVVRQ